MTIAGLQCRRGVSIAHHAMPDKTNKPFVFRHLHSTVADLRLIDPFCHTHSVCTRLDSENAGGGRGSLTGPFNASSIAYCRCDPFSLSILYGTGTHRHCRCRHRRCCHCFFSGAERLRQSGFARAGAGAGRRVYRPQCSNPAHPYGQLGPACAPLHRTNASSSVLTRACPGFSGQPAWVVTGSPALPRRAPWLPNGLQKEGAVIQPQANLPLARLLR